MEAMLTPRPITATVAVVVSRSGLIVLANGKIIHPNVLPAEEESMLSAVGEITATAELYQLVQQAADLELRQELGATVMRHLEGQIERFNHEYIAQ